MQEFDILIIGNGILGLSTAYALIQKEPKLRIGILGPKHQAYSGTLAAGAMLGAYGEITRSTFSSPYGLSKLKIAIQAATMWPSWIHELNEILPQNEQISINSGTFILLNGKSSRLDDYNFGAILNGLSLHKEPYEEICSSDIPGLNPIEDCRPLRALYLPKEGSIDSERLMFALQKCIEASKTTTIIHDVAKIIEQKQNKISVYTEKNESIQASNILIAAGSNSQQLINQLHPLKNNIPLILTGVGNAILLKKPPVAYNHVIRTPNRAGACGIHVLPRNDSLYVGASNHWALHPSQNPKVKYLHYLMKNSGEQINQDFENSEVIQILTGNRPITVDGFPLVGKTSIPGVFVLTGTYRDGLHNSPLLAAHIANLMLSKKCSLIENYFHPERLPIQTVEKEKSIEDAVDDFIGAGYDHSMNLPRIGWELMFKDMVRKHLYEIYYKLETNYALPPELLSMLSRCSENEFNFFKNYYAKLEKSLKFHSTSQISENLNIEVDIT